MSGWFWRFTILAGVNLVAGIGNAVCALQGDWLNVACVPVNLAAIAACIWALYLEVRMR